MNYDMQVMDKFPIIIAGKMYGTRFYYNSGFGGIYDKFKNTRGPFYYPDEKYGILSQLSYIINIDDCIYLNNVKDFISQ